MQKKHKLFAGYAVASLVLIILWFLNPYRDFFSSPEKIQAFLLAFGSFAAIALVLLQVMQVIVPVIPGQALQFAGGFIYGWWQGFILSTIGTAIGTTIVFVLAKRYGRPFVLKWVSKRELAHVNAYVKGHGKSTIFILRLIPFFPNDAVSFACGLTEMKLKDFLFYSFLGYIPGFLLLNVMGDQLAEGIINKFTIFGMVLLTLMSLVYLFRHKLKVLLINEIREAEHELKNDVKKYKVLEDDLAFGR